MSAALVVVAAFLCGHGLLGRWSRSSCDPARLATTAVAGLVVLVAAATLAVLVLGPLSPAAGRVLLAVLALPGIVALVRGRAVLASPGVEPPRHPEPWTALHVLGAVALAWFAAFTVFASATLPVHVFDAVFHYGYKAQLVFHEGFGTAAWTDFDGAVGRVHTHPRYPPFVPMLHVLASWVAGSYDGEAARPLGALFALAPAAWAWSGLRERGRGAALVASLLWLGLPLLYYTRLPHDELVPAARALVAGLPLGPAASGWRRVDGWTLDATADLPLAALLFGAFVSLGALARSTDGARARAVSAGVLLGGAVTTKNEGLPLALLLLAACGVALLAERRDAGERLVGSTGPSVRASLALVLTVLLCTVLVPAAWWIARGAIPAVDEHYPSLLTPARVVDAASRAPDVAAHFAASFVDVLRWNLLWPAWALVVGWSLVRRRSALVRRRVLAAVLFVLGGCALYVVVLLVTPWPLERIARTGIPDRLLLHLAPFAAVAIASLLWADEPSRT